jgi:hypothetical protein
MALPSDEQCAARIDGGQRWLLDACDVQDAIAKQDSEIGALAGLLCQRVQMRQRFDP